MGTLTCYESSTTAGDNELVTTDNLRTRPHTPLGLSGVYLGTLHWAELTWLGGHTCHLHHTAHRQKKNEITRTYLYARTLQECKNDDSTDDRGPSGRDRSPSTPGRPIDWTKSSSLNKQLPHATQQGDTRIGQGIHDHTLLNYPAPPCVLHPPKSPWGARTTDHNRR